MKYTASPGLRNLFRHLSIVSSHYQDREKARIKFDKHVKKLEKTGLTDEIGSLNNHIGLLLEKEIKVAELGLGKTTPKDKLTDIKAEIQAIKDERDKLLKENKNLKENLDGLDDPEIENRIIDVERKVEKKYDDHMREELKQQIAFLESKYKNLEEDNTIHPARLYKVKEKLKKLKHL